MLRSITPSEDLFSITWTLGPRCNFECSYCPPRLHDKTSPHLSLDDMKARWEDILTKSRHINKQYKLSFTGGEVTINPDFLPFLHWLKGQHGESIASLGFITNGSASMRYYIECMDLVDYISFSSHYEFMNVDKFKKNVLACHIKSVKRRKNIYVNIMDESFSQPEIQDLVQFCLKHRIPHDKNPIDWSISARGKPPL